MMRKILLSMSLLSAGLCLAIPLSPEEALQRLNNDALTSATRAAASAVPVMTMATQQGSPSLYVFNKQDISGFMVVSADDAVTPLLGYSDDAFDPENISPALQYWLDQYNSQIEYARKNPEAGVFVENTIQLPNWAPISPMIKTKWNQNAPYYNLCPTLNGEACNTGCVATAMSQVMKYWEYPAKGKGSISYECSSLNRTLSLDFSTITFDWANMLNNYNGNYSTEEANAVAELMQATGYSVRMSYSPGTSGAVSGLINGALVNYFSYDESAYYAVRDLYTYSDWAAMIYDNLKNVGPVIYDGNGVSEGGHSFVCDGYQGNGYFHFNWGWGGSGDGYFLLDALNPSSLGIGGGGGGFNFLQDAILNIKPADSTSDSQAQEIMVIYGSVLGIFNNDLLNLDLTGKSFLGWSYKGLEPVILNMGAIFEPADGSNAPVINAISTNSNNQRILFDPISYLPLDGQYGMQTINLRPTFNLNALGLQKGVKYKVTAAFNLAESDNWKAMEASVGSYNYCYVTKTGDGSDASDFQIENFYPMQLTCTDVTFNSTLYNGIAADVTINLVNTNDTELTRGVALQLYDESGKLRYVGDSFVISLAPGESITQNWLSVLTAQTNTTVARALPLYVALYDPETATEYYRSETTVSMQASPGRAFYNTELSIEDAEFRANKYQVATSADFNAVFTIDVTRNIFSLPVTLWIATQNGNSYSRILTYPLDTMVVEAGETQNVVMNMSYPDAKVGATYYIVSLIDGSYDNAIPFVAMSNQAGIEDIIADDDVPFIIYDKTVGKAYVKGGNTIEVYSLSGMKLSTTIDKTGDSATVDLTGLGKGVVIVKATGSQGKTTSVKIAL